MRNARARTAFALREILTSRLATVFAACTLTLLLSPSRAAAQTSTNLGSLQFAVQSSSPTGATKYISVYVSITQGGSTIGDWFELPYTGGASPQVTFTDLGGTPATLSNVGFFLSPTQIPLDNLNLTDEPPPGLPGSTYTPLPSLDSSLNPGASESATTPDSSWTMALLMGAVALLVAAQRQLQGPKLSQCKPRIHSR